jgi:hypothetical protein
VEVNTSHSYHNINMELISLIGFPLKKVGHTFLSILNINKDFLTISILILTIVISILWFYLFSFHNYIYVYFTLKILIRLKRNTIVDWIDISMDFIMDLLNLTRNKLSWW